jgi:hypothetical protein
MKLPESCRHTLFSADATTSGTLHVQRLKGLHKPVLCHMLTQQSLLRVQAHNESESLKESRPPAVQQPPCGGTLQVCNTLWWPTPLKPPAVEAFGQAPCLILTPCKVPNTCPHCCCCCFCCCSPVRVFVCSVCHLVHDVCTHCRVLHQLLHQRPLL